MNFNPNYRIALLLSIDFGDIDGLYDANISDYFIDNQYKESLVNKFIYFVIGRKGTGKSALYNWLHRNQVANGNMVSNLSFNDFPFEKLLQLSDDDFAKPNQYQSIWRNIIYSEFAKLLVMDESNPLDEDLKELNKYTKLYFGDDLTDLHKQVTRNATKSSAGIGYDKFNFSQESSREIILSDGFNNLTKINNRLRQVIESYLKRHNTKQYIIQFDQLDDNYTNYVNNSNYTQCIISLFKSIYDTNQRFRSYGIPAKAVAYLRSDIFNTFNKHDAESARWDQYVLKLNWAIINKDDWKDAALLKLINARIKRSHPSLSQNSLFHLILDKNIIGLRLPAKPYPADIFRYIIHRTFQRPRDIIQFCIKIQEECRSTKSLDYQTILNAEKEFSLWLLGEVENEIAPLIPDTESLYELLRLMGQQEYSMNDFKKRYSTTFTEKINMDAETLLKVLYSFGIINNINMSQDGSRKELFSVIRNDRSIFNRDLKIITHPGFYKGLHVSKFSTK